jgi:nitroreductase
MMKENMMDTLEAIRTRRSIRRYVDKPIPFNEIGLKVDQYRRSK